MKWKKQKCRSAEKERETWVVVGVAVGAEEEGLLSGGGGGGERRQ